MKNNNQPQLKPNKRSKKIQAGDYFAIPLRNGEYGLGQVFENLKETTGSAACVIFSKKFFNGMPAVADEEDIVAARYVVEPLIKRYFPIVGYDAIDDNLKYRLFPEIERYRQGSTVGMTTSQTGIIEMFLNAYFGLSPWDECADPNYYESLLISPDKKPENLIYSKK